MFFLLDELNEGMHAELFIIPYSIQCCLLGKLTRVTLKTVSKIFPADGTLLNFFVLGGIMASAAARISVQNGRLSFITYDSLT